MDNPKPDEDIQQWIDALHERQKNHDRQGKAKDQAKQRSIQGLSSPLPRRTMPRPWEDLASVIGRTAQAMGYSQPGWILRPEKTGHSIPSEALPLLKWQLDYELLGRLLDLDESTLHGLTLHRFAARVSSRSAAIPAETTGMQRFPRLNKLPRLWNAQRLFAYSGRTIQVCPRCLDEPDGGYDRLYWRA
jgi:TniQ